MIRIPTKKELYDSILADLQSGFGITMPTFGKSFLRAFAAQQAAKLQLYYLAIGNLQKNIFVDTADPESMGGTLERFGRVKIGRNPYPASQGQYSITVTGLFGGILPAQTTFKSDDSSMNPGKLYILDTEHVMSATTDSITVRALESGIQSRLAIGDTLTATAPIINVDGGAAVNSEVIVPNAAETIEDYRRVVMQSYMLEPQGGASADYRLWGLDAEGVKQIYPYAASGAQNEINVFVEAVLIDSTDGMGTPTTTILNDVKSVIEADPDTGRGRRPLGVFAVNVMPVVINKISIQFTGYAGLTDAQKLILFQALKEAIEKVRPFIGGADVLAERNDSFGVNNIISTAVATLPGVPFGSVEMIIQVGAGTPAPVASKIFDNGNIPFLTTVTYA